MVSRPIAGAGDAGVAGRVMDETQAAQRLRGVGAALERLGDRLERGEPVEAESIDLAVAQLKGLRYRAFGPRRGSDTAKSRLRHYLMANVGQSIAGVELAEVA